MGRIVLFASVSVDGFMAGPNGELDWHLVDDEVHAHVNEVLAGMSMFASGRRTHELMAGFWPTADRDPSSTPPMVEFARIWRDKPKIVYSRTLGHADWNTTIVRAVVPEEVRTLTSRTPGDITLSGADLAASFRELDLIDEYRLYVHPALIGRGMPLFSSTDARSDLALLETRAFGNGVVLLRYERAVPGAAPGG